MLVRVKYVSARDGRQAVKQGSKGWFDLAVASKNVPLNYSKSISLWLFSSFLVDISTL